MHRLVTPRSLLLAADDALTFHVHIYLRHAEFMALETKADIYANEPLDIRRHGKSHSCLELRVGYVKPSCANRAQPSPSPQSAHTAAESNKILSMWIVAQDKSAQSPRLTEGHPIV